MKDRIYKFTVKMVKETGTIRDIRGYGWLDSKEEDKEIKEYDHHISLTIKVRECDTLYYILLMADECWKKWRKSK